METHQQEMRGEERIKQRSERTARRDGNGKEIGLEQRLRACCCTAHAYLASSAVNFPEVACPRRSLRLTPSPYRLPDIIAFCRN
ncbi:hypothetical protein EYF80_049383 [Liparis tanakae]|uniref:Uncharacterized protein n=1 Tax=Liparis tanakae TaxID=230148 RepID=A0A4Z2FHP3_9TELE|nr:hypothetical protein EYF80_049383 [Liparis tanakae]